MPQEAVTHQILRGAILQQNLNGKIKALKIFFKGCCHQMTFILHTTLYSIINYIYLLLT